METLSHWAKSLKSGDKCLATIRHQTEGSKNLINQELTVVHNGELKDSLIGKLNDGTVLRVPYNELTELKLETLYRKVAVSERLPKKMEYVTTIDTENQHIIYRLTDFGWNMRDEKGENSPNNNYKIAYWLEEVPDNESKTNLSNAILIEKLEADKEELLDFMKELKDRFEHYNDKVSMFQIESLIQKHKQ